MNPPASPAGTTPPNGAPPEGSAPADKLPETRPHRSLLNAARLVSFTVLCGLLFWGKVVAIPLALAVLFSFTLNPLVKRLQKWKLPRPAAVGIVVTVACAAIFALSWLIGSQIYSLAGDIPKQKDNITAKIKEVRNFFKGGAVES